MVQAVDPGRAAPLLPLAGLLRQGQPGVDLLVAAQPVGPDVEGAQLRVGPGGPPPAGAPSHESPGWYEGGLCLGACSSPPPCCAAAPGTGQCDLLAATQLVWGPQYTNKALNRPGPPCAESSTSSQSIHWAERLCIVKHNPTDHKSHKMSPDTGNAVEGLPETQPCLVILNDLQLALEHLCKYWGHR